MNSPSANGFRADFLRLADISATGNVQELHQTVSRIAEQAQKMTANSKAANASWMMALVEHCASADLSRESRLYAQSLLSAAEVLYTHGAITYAAEATRLAVEAAKHCQDQQLKRRAHSVLGAMLTFEGDQAGALAALDVALDISREIADKVGEIHVLTNICATLGRIGNHEECIRVASDILASPLIDDHPSLVELAYINATNGHLQLGRFAEGLALAEAFAPRITPPENSTRALQRLTFENTYICLLLLLGRPEEALARIAIVDAIAEQFPLPEAKTRSLIVRALFEAYTSNNTIATRSLTFHLTEVPDSSNAHIDILFALSNIYQKMKRPKIASHYIAMRLKQLQQMQTEMVSNNIRSSAYTNGLSSDDQHDLSRPISGKLSGARLRRRLKTVQNSHQEALEWIATLAELRDRPYGRHAYRVAKLAGLIAIRMDLGAMVADEIERAARLHDLGKIALPNHLWRLRRPLTETEKHISQQHTFVGAEMLDGSNMPPSPFVQLAMDIMLYHHERWDGTGFPGKLSGEDIPLAARITAIANEFDHLAFDNERLPHISFVLAEMTSRRGTHFDPKVFDAFEAVVSELWATRGKEIGAYLARDLEKHSQVSTYLHLVAAQESSADVRARGLRQRRLELDHISRLSTTSEYAAGMAHEVNQPLATALLSVQTCLNLIQQGVEDYTQLESALRISEEKIGEVGAMLKRSRNLAGRHTADLAQIDLNAVVENLRQTLQQQLVDQGIRLTTRLADGLPLVWGDELYAEHVLYQLVQNALESMKGTQQKVLSLETGIVDASHCYVGVTDTGSGMDEFVEGKLYEPFFSTKNGAVGLGLNVVKSLMQSFGGEVSFQRQEKGVRFVLTFNVAVDTGLEPVQSRITR